MLPMIINWGSYPQCAHLDVACTFGRLETSASFRIVTQSATWWVLEDTCTVSLQKAKGLVQLGWVHMQWA